MVIVLWVDLSQRCDTIGCVCVVYMCIMEVSVFFEFFEFGAILGNEKTSGFRIE